MKKIFYTTALIFVTATLGFYFALSKGYISSEIPFVKRTFPAQTDPKTVTLSCDYHGQKLALSETLYGSVDNFYKTEPKKKLSYFANSNKDFVFSYPEDKTVSDLTDKIEETGSRLGLNSDQTVDLAACFIQSIPYDQAKAQKILGPNFKSYPTKEVIPRYPYETLYDFTGICTDKSYLGAAVFSKMGYGTSLLGFDADRHLSIGLSVPSGYGELGTKYGIMELTGSGFLVGDIPVLKNTGFAENTINNLPEISNSSQTQSESKALSNPNKVELISDGKEYGRIVERTELRKQIESLKQQLSQQLQVVQASQGELQTAESKLKSAESYYKANPSRGGYSEYLSIYNSYQQSYGTTNNKISDYNNLVKKYNSLVEKYKNY